MDACCLGRDQHLSESVSMGFSGFRETPLLIICSRTTYSSRHDVTIDGHSSIGRYPGEGGRNWRVAAKRFAEKAVQVGKFVEIMELSS